jgi:hypothetical protein
MTVPTHHPRRLYEVPGQKYESALQLLMPYRPPRTARTDNISFTLLVRMALLPKSTNQAREGSM